jgi:hypothetical protein
MAGLAIAYGGKKILDYILKNKELNIRDREASAKLAIAGQSENIDEAGMRPGPDFSIASRNYNGYVLGGEDDSDDDRRATHWGIYQDLGDGTYKFVTSVKDPKYNGKYPVSSFASGVPIEAFKWTVDTYFNKTEETELDELLGIPLTRKGRAIKRANKAAGASLGQEAEQMEIETLVWMQQSGIRKLNPRDFKLYFDQKGLGDVAKTVLDPMPAFTNLSKRQVRQIIQQVLQQAYKRSSGFGQSLFAPGKKS